MDSVDNCLSLSPVEKYFESTLFSSSEFDTIEERRGIERERESERMYCVSCDDRLPERERERVSPGAG